MITARWIAGLCFFVLFFHHASIPYAQDCPNEVVNGDFSDGNTGFLSDLSYNCSCLAASYCVGAEPRDKCTNSYWIQSLWDHTLGTAAGSFLIIDGAGGSYSIWNQNVNVINGETYEFAFWIIREISDASFNNSTQGIEFKVNGNSVGSFNNATDPENVWVRHNTSWTATQSGSVSIEIVQNANTGWNDFGIDDIEFRALNCDSTPTNLCVGQGEKTFVRSFGGAGLDGVLSEGLQFEDGSYYVLAETKSYGFGEYDIMLNKFDPNGNLLWVKNYGTSRNDRAFCIRKSASNDLLICGYTYLGNVAEVSLMKLDTAGNIVWKKQYDAPGWDNSYSLEELSNGDILVFAYNNVVGQGDFDYAILRVDAFGDLLWWNFYGGNGYEVAQSSVRNSSNTFLAAGRTESYGTGDFDMSIYEVDENGNINWHKSYGGGQYEILTRINATADGNYLAVGETESYGVGKKDIIVLKLDESGNVFWSKTYGTSGDDISRNFFQTPEEDYVIVGTSDGFGNDNDIVAFKINVQGEIIWTKRFAGAGEDYGSLGYVNPDGGYTIVGYGESYGNGDKDVLMFRITSCGAGCSNENAEIIATDVNLNVVNSSPSKVSSGNQSTSAFSTGEASVELSEYCSENLISCFVKADFMVSDTILCKENRVYFANNSTNGAAFDWKINGKHVSDEEQLYYEFDESGTYNVSLTVTEDSCVSTKEVEIQKNVIGIQPNIITPNNDNVNSVFRIPQENILDLRIYNRWGTLIFETEDYLDDWNASNHPDGTYFYVGNTYCREIKGWLTVVR